MTAPRIVQVLEYETARALLFLFPLRAVQPIVALDDRGLLWFYGPEGSGSARLIWHRLPLPPLPDGEGGT